MVEEFEESEVMFEEKSSESIELEDNLHWVRDQGVKRKKMIGKENSPPMKIPAAVRNAWARCVEAELEGGEDGEMVPPHVIIGRRVAGKMMAFSICSGKGRALKGRDLSQVRNSILRMTGFLET